MESFLRPLFSNLISYNVKNTFYIIPDIIILKAQHTYSA